MAYNYDEESVNAIIKWAENAQLPKEVVLSEAEHITDTSIYVRANINDIKQHYPDGFYNPAHYATVQAEGICRRDGGITVPYSCIGGNQISPPGLPSSSARIHISCLDLHVLLLMSF